MDEDEEEEEDDEEEKRKRKRKRKRLQPRPLDFSGDYTGAADVTCCVGPKKRM